MGLFDRAKRICIVCLMLLLLLSLAGCSLFKKEERVFDAFYDAEEIAVHKLGLDYEMLHNSDLPFYKGDSPDHVVVYVNAEDDDEKPFDRLWIIVSPETESEAIVVLDDFEEYLGDGVSWRRDDDALSGVEMATDVTQYMIMARYVKPWQRDFPPDEYANNIKENTTFGENSEVYWYARRYKTMILIMDLVHYEYVINGEAYALDDEQEWEVKKNAFDDFFENQVDTEAFWE